MIHVKLITLCMLMFSGSLRAIVDMAGHNLRASTMGRYSFVKAKLMGTGLEYCYLSDSDFEGADATGANFARAYLIGCKFGRTILTGANFEGAHVQGVDFSQATGLSDEQKDLLRKLGAIVK